MATPQPRTRTARLSDRLGVGLLLGLTACVTLTLLPGSASAAPGDPVVRAGTADEATRLVSDATRELQVVTEQFNDAQEVLAEQRAAADAAGQALATAQGQLAALDEQVRRVARSAFTGEAMSRFNALMTSGSAEEFLSQVTTLDAIAGHTTEVLAQVHAAAQAAEQAKAAAEAAAGEAAAGLAEVTSRQADLEGRITEYRAQFDSLSEVQQQAVVQEHAGPTLTPPAPAEVVAPSAGLQAAVDTALAQIGDPYVWGAGGPNAFDCSGLTQYAYAAAGIRLPHSSRVQATMGTAVSRADLQPGDLVFFYRPVSHVGLYVGNGKMVHAPTFGSPVVVTGVDMAGYVGARRLVG